MSNVKHIYLVRHAQSRTNETGVLEGEDTPLTGRGVQEAQAVAERFRNLPIELLVSSPYIRAHETAKHIGIVTKAPIEVFENAKERGLPSSLLGKHRDDPAVQLAMSSFKYDWTHDSNIDEGEPFVSLLERAQNLIAFLEKKEEKCITVVSHGFFIEFFTAYQLLGDYLTPDLFANSILKKVKSLNTAVTYFQIQEDDHWLLYSWNDLAHLEQFTTK